MLGNRPVLCMYQPCRSVMSSFVNQCSLRNRRLLVAYSDIRPRIGCNVAKILRPFVSGTHHYECVAPNVDINLQSGRFWAMSIASFTDRFIDFRSCWIVFIHVLRVSSSSIFEGSNGNFRERGFRRDGRQLEAQDFFALLNVSQPCLWC